MDEFPHVLEKYARRTVRLYQAQEDIAFALGGEVGRRLADALTIDSAVNNKNAPYKSKEDSCLSP